MALNSEPCFDDDTDPYSVATAFRGSYHPGDIVIVDNKKFECRSFPFGLLCNNPAYEPPLPNWGGHANLWRSAWDPAGSCSFPTKAPLSPSPAPSVNPITRDPPSPAPFSPGLYAVTSIQVVTFQNAKQIKFEDDIKTKFCGAYEDHLTSSEYLTEYVISEVSCYGFNFEPDDPFIRRFLQEENEDRYGMLYFASNVTGTIRPEDRLKKKKLEEEFGPLTEDSINRDTQEVKRKLEERQILAVTDSMVRANKVGPTLSVPILAYVPVAPDEPVQSPMIQGSSDVMSTSNNGFASSAAGIAVIVTFSLLALLIAGLLFYKAMNGSIPRKDVWDEDDYSSRAADEWTEKTDEDGAGAIVLHNNQRSSSDHSRVEETRIVLHNNQRSSGNHSPVEENRLVLYNNGRPPRNHSPVEENRIVLSSNESTRSNHSRRIGRPSHNHSRVGETRDRRITTGTNATAKRVSKSRRKRTGSDTSHEELEEGRGRHETNGIGKSVSEVFEQRIREKSSMADNEGKVRFNTPENDEIGSQGSRSRPPGRGEEQSSSHPKKYFTMNDFEQTISRKTKNLQRSQARPQEGGTVPNQGLDDNKVLSKSAPKSSKERLESKAIIGHTRSSTPEPFEKRIQHEAQPKAKRSSASGLFEQRLQKQSQMEVFEKRIRLKSEQMRTNDLQKSTGEQPTRKRHDHKNKTRRRQKRPLLKEADSSIAVFFC